MGCYVIVTGSRLLGIVDDDNAVIEISVTFYQLTWHSNSEDLNLQQCRGLADFRLCNCAVVQNNVRQMGSRA